MRGADQPPRFKLDLTVEVRPILVGGVNIGWNPESSLTPALRDNGLLRGEPRPAGEGTVYPLLLKRDAMASIPVGVGMLGLGTRGDGLVLLLPTAFAMMVGNKLAAVSTTVEQREDGLLYHLALPRGRPFSMRVMNITIGLLLPVEP